MTAPEGTRCGWWVPSAPRVRSSSKLVPLLLHPAREPSLGDVGTRGAGDRARGPRGPPDTSRGLGGFWRRAGTAPRSAGAKPTYRRDPASPAPLAGSPPTTCARAKAPSHPPGPVAGGCRWGRAPERGRVGGEDGGRGVRARRRGLGSPEGAPWWDAQEGGPWADPPSQRPPSPGRPPAQCWVFAPSPARGFVVAPCDAGHGTSTLCWWPQRVAEPRPGDTCPPGTGPSRERGVGDMPPSCWHPCARSGVTSRKDQA